MEFKWEWNESKDDGTCRLGKYLLRVEGLDKGLWWFSSHYNGEMIFVDKQYANTRYRAMGCAEGIVMGHLSVHEHLI